MTPEELDAALALCYAATPGPWHTEHRAECDGMTSYVCLEDGYWLAGMEETARTSADAEFIAAARTGWPAALESVRKLRARLGISELLRVEDVGDASQRQHNAEVQRDELQARLENVLAICDKASTVTSTPGVMVSSLYGIRVAAVRRAASPPEAVGDE